ncbi:MAG: Holliday junction branch migration protein RuvA [Lachnospiraceae bacterium]|nr:Holliday junction branch migration protein RuvA [Lachnospiraceae bacterium]
MISFIRGYLSEIYEDSIVIESNGVGFSIGVPSSVLSELPAVGSEMKIHTWLQVGENLMALYGFSTKDDLRIFKMLIGVNGIGPKGALAILSTIRPDDLRFAILSGDAKAIAKAPGVGLKTAQKVILELKDKLSLEEAVELKRDAVAGRSGKSTEPLGSAREDALEVLTALGYSPTDALKAVRNVEITEGMSAETVVKQALKRIGMA